MYIVGVDVAKRSHEATVIDSSGNTIRKAFNFKNDAGGFQKLLSVLEAVSTNPADFIVGMESTSHYWLALYSNLQRRGYTVHALLPPIFFLFRIFPQSFRKYARARNHASGSSI